MKRLIYSSAEKQSPKKQAEINYLLQKQIVKRITKEIDQLVKQLHQEQERLNELEEIYKSY